MLLELWATYKSMYNVFKEGYVDNEMDPNARYHRSADPTKRNEVYKRIACKNVGMTQEMTEAEVYKFEKNIIYNKTLDKLTDLELKYIEFIYFHTLLPESTFEADLSRFHGCIGNSLITALVFIKNQLTKKYRPTHYVKIEMTKINMKKVYQQIPNLFLSDHTKKYLPRLFWECNKRYGLNSNIVSMVVGRYLDGFEELIDKHKTLQNKKISCIRYNQTILILLPRKGAIEIVEDICKKFFAKKEIEIKIIGREITDTSTIYFDKAMFVYSKNKIAYFKPREIYISNLFRKLNEIEKKYKKKEYTKEQMVNEMCIIVNNWLDLYKVYCTSYTLNKISVIIEKIMKIHSIGQIEEAKVAKLLNVDEIVNAEKMVNEKIQSKHWKDTTKKMKKHIIIYNKLRNTQ